MAYFVFEIRPPRSLRRVAAHERYRDAREDVRLRRRDPALAEGCEVRMVHAASVEDAERLLQERRDPRALGEDA